MESFLRFGYLGECPHRIPGAIVVPRSARDHVILPEALAADETQPHAAVGGLEPLTEGLDDVGGKIYRDPVVFHWINPQCLLGTRNHRRV
jgi:hypothetical protein